MLTLSEIHSISKQGSSSVVRPDNGPGSATKPGITTTSNKTSGQQSHSTNHSLTPLLSDNAPGKLPPSEVFSSSSTGYINYSDYHHNETPSDFKAFNKEELSEQFAVSQSLDTKRKTHLKKADLDKVSAKIVRTFSAKTKHCKNNCLFRGIICLKDGRLLLLDILNFKLKMFDNKCNIICSEETRGSGWGVAKVSDNEIAVLIDNKHVYFYKITKEKFVLQTQTFKRGKKDMEYLTAKTYLS